MICWAGPWPIRKKRRSCTRYWTRGLWSPPAKNFVFWRIGIPLVCQDKGLFLFPIGPDLDQVRIVQYPFGLHFLEVTARIPFSVTIFIEDDPYHIIGRVQAQEFKTLGPLGGDLAEHLPFFVGQLHDQGVGYLPFEIYPQIPEIRQ